MTEGSRGRRCGRLLPRCAALGVLAIVAGMPIGSPVADRESVPAVAQPSFDQPLDRASPGLEVLTQSQRDGARALRFEPNRGQAPAGVPFVGRGTGDLLLRSNEVVLPPLASNESLRSNVPASMRLVGGRDDALMEGLGLLPGTSNYFTDDDTSRWQTGVPHFAQVLAREVYAGIDVLYRSAPGGFEYDWLVGPEADPGQIAVSFPGSTDVTIAVDGDLVVTTPSGTVRQHGPVAFQDGRGGRTRVPAGYVVNEGVVTLDLGAWDNSRPLVIDPVVTYASYLGGPGTERAYGLDVDPAGNAYLVAGAGAGFPTAPDTVYSPSPDGGGGLTVTKVAPDGTLIYATYLSGGQSPTVLADGAGNAYVVGGTNGGFPTVGEYRACEPVQGDMPFLAKLDPSGSELLYSTCLEDTSGANRATLGPDGVVYVAGTVDVRFPFTPVNALDDTVSGPTDVWLMGVDTNQSGADSLLFSTFLGGNGYDNPLSMTSRGDEVFVAGFASSPVNPFAPIEDFPVGEHRFSEGCPASTEGDGYSFLLGLRLPRSGSPQVTYSACGAGIGGGGGMTVDETSGVVYLTTGSDPPPGVENVIDLVPQSSSLGAVAVLDPSVSGPASILTWARIGAFANHIALAPDGRLWAAGRTTPGGLEVPPPVSSYGPGGGDDVFVMEFDLPLIGEPSLVSVLTLGGADADVPSGIGATPIGEVWVTGGTRSADFPVLPGGLQSGPAGDEGSLDLFLVRVSPTPRLDRLEPAVGSTCSPTSVLLQGAHLESTTSVLFGDAPAGGVEVVGAGEILAQSPPGGEAGTVDVRALVGEAESNAVAFEYREPVAVPEGLAPAQGPTTGGTEVSVTGSGLGCSQEVRFGDMAGTDLQVISDTEVRVMAPAQAAGAVDVVVVAAGGSSSPEGTLRFSYVPPPPAVASVAPDCGPASGETEMVVTGTGLEAATEVRFDDRSVIAVPDPSSGGSRVTAVTPPGLDEEVRVSVLTPTGPADGTATFRTPCTGTAGEAPPDGSTGEAASAPADNTAVAAPPSGGGGSPGSAFSTNPGPIPSSGNPFLSPSPAPVPGASPAPTPGGAPGAAPTPANPASAAPSPPSAFPAPGAVPTAAPVPGAVPGIAGAGKGAESPAGSQGFAMVATTDISVPGGPGGVVLATAALGLLACLLIGIGGHGPAPRRSRERSRPSPVFR